MFDVFGQRNQIEYIRSSDSSYVSFSDRDQGKYLSWERFNWYKEGIHFDKYIFYDQNGNVRDYDLSYTTADENTELYERLYLTLSFENNECTGFGVSHQFHEVGSDTPFFDLTAEKYKKDWSYAHVEVESNLNDTTLVRHFKNPNVLLQYYWNWVKEDMQQPNTMQFPDWPPIDQWNVAKIDKSYRQHDSIDNGNIMRQIKITSTKTGEIWQTDTTIVGEYFSEKYIISDTLEYKAHGSSDESGKTYQGYSFFPTENRTEQLLYQTKNGDTVYYIDLKTQLVNDTLISLYNIKGTHPKEVYFGELNYYQGKFPTVLNRKIEIRRNLDGYIVGGKYSGLVVDANFKTYDSRCDIIIHGQKNLYIVGSRCNFHGRVPVKLSNGNLSYVNYDIVSAYPNIDLHPLIDFQRLNHDHTMNGKKITLSWNKGFRWPRLRLRRNKPFYKRGTERVLKEKHYERWEELNSDRAYELFYE